MLSYKLEKFEGPLDLLLHLIEKNKVSIYDIPIFEITNQYMEYVNAMEEEDLDIVSEFLVMTATLLDIKSRLLLPAEKDENGDEIDPREELVTRLVEYKTYKSLGEQLKADSFWRHACFTRIPQSQMKCQNMSLLLMCRIC